MKIGIGEGNSNEDSLVVRLVLVFLVRSNGVLV